MLLGTRYQGHETFPFELYKIIFSLIVLKLYITTLKLMPTPTRYNFGNFFSIFLKNQHFCYTNHTHIIHYRIHLNRYRLNTMTKTGIHFSTRTSTPHTIHLCNANPPLRLLVKLLTQETAVLNIEQSKHCTLAMPRKTMIQLQ